METLPKLSPVQSLLLRAAARRADGRLIPPTKLRGGARAKAMTALMRREWIEARVGGAGVQTANPANLGLHADGGEAPRSRPPYGNFAGKDPFRLGQSVLPRGRAGLHSLPKRSKVRSTRR